MSLVGKWLAESGLEGPAAALDTLRAATAEADAAARDAEVAGGIGGGGTNADTSSLLSSQLLELSAAPGTTRQGRPASPPSAWPPTPTSSMRAPSRAARPRRPPRPPRSSPRGARASSGRSSSSAPPTRPSSAGPRPSWRKIPRDRPPRTPRPAPSRQEKYLAWHIATQKKQLAADLAFPSELARNERAYLSTAISAYGRALGYADAHDLHAMHRFVALFLAHGRKGAAVVVEEEGEAEGEAEARRTVAEQQRLRARALGPANRL